MVQVMRGDDNVFLIGEALLEKEGVLEEEGVEQMERSARSRIEQAFERAASLPEPEPESALEDVYA
ncbi:thiamine pyrophosphate-dependent enzyme [Rubrobacter naiadicus]|uniref:thiamine pyrophosphate-dependent enzyme n=1 Tax=Rubrobacter naiadicus TaxID=1392641 RepID=UPI0023624AAE|nr:thiamine pyrophosphate-dependent enzyme [Rubrobacter naiadicus]